MSRARLAWRNRRDDKITTAFYALVGERKEMEDAELRLILREVAKKVGTTTAAVTHVLRRRLGIID